MNQAVGPAALILLAIPAFALRLAMRALYGPQRTVGADPMQTLLSLASAILFVMAALGAAVGLLGFWALIILLPIVAPMVIARLRHSQHRALVWALAAAAERGIPLSEAARAYADETQGDTGVRAVALAEAIERGEPLSSAVRVARLRMSSAVKMAVRMGDQLGLLGSAMRQQLRDSQQVDAVLRETIGRFFYLGTVIVVLTAVVTFVMLKIVPVFQRMFQDFGLKLPEITQTVISMSNWYVSYGWWKSAPLMLILPLFLLAGILYYIDWFPRNLPLVWRLFRRYDGALVMRGLALALRRGVPLPQAMQMVADCYPLSIVAHRMRGAANRVAGGMNWCDSLRQTGLIGQADAAVLAAAQRVGNLDWALEEMADSALRRQIYRVQALLQILFPIAVLLLGGVVLLFVVGMFIPLISLIQGLA